MTSKSKVIKQQMKLMDLTYQFISAEEWETIPQKLYDIAHNQSRHSSVGIAHDKKLGWCVIAIYSTGLTLVHCDNIKEWDKV